MSSMLDTLAGTPPPDDRRPETTNGKAHVSFVPYDARLDSQASDFLAWLWRRMQNDDLVDYYFPGQKETGFATFVRMMSGDAQVALVVTDVDSNQWEDKIAGFITWTPAALGAANMAIGGFIFFRKFWDHATTAEAGIRAFHYWFEVMEKPFDVVLGVCPSLHKVALRYNARIGLKEIGRIPKAHLFKGETCDAVLVAMTRDEWMARQKGAS